MKEFIDKLIERLAENRRPIVTNDEDLEWNRAMYLCTGIVNQLAEEYNNDVCEWKQHEREIDVYFTECGQAHIFVDGNPEENNYEYCPYCGKKIKIVGD